MTNTVKPGNRFGGLVEIPIIKVADICGIWLKHSGNSHEFRARCPFCNGQKNRPTASINTAKNVFYCHRCHEGHNAVSLYAKLVGTDNRQAYRELMEDAA